MTTKRYGELRKMARKVLADADASGWRLARITHEAVESLKRSEKITQGSAIKRWAKDIDHGRFSPASAQRYFTVWRKYGKTREVDANGKELSFAEHYAIVRGGRNAKRVMEHARSTGHGAQAAAQKMMVEQGDPVTGVMRHVLSAHRALEQLREYQRNTPLTAEEVQLLSEALAQMRHNVMAARKAVTEDN